MRGYRQIVRITAVALLALVVASCTATFRNHGYMPSDEELDLILVGVDTRESLEGSIGAPGTSGLLTGTAWYFVQSRFRHFAYNAPEEIERQVLAISFNDRGVVENVEQFGLEDGRVIVLSRRVTESNIKGITFIKQLFGSFGQVDVSNLL
ncbi:MAG: outer membrane protein assembly factor BamE [Rhodobacteraceae bacterium]|nr:outer membrane protein assembly factor BamE [Paracoccaceae bacterium]